MAALPPPSNVPPFRPRATLRTSRQHSQNRLLLIFPYRRRLPPCTSSAACARFRLRRQKSSQNEVITLQKRVDVLIREHCTQMALTFQSISTLSSQIVSIANAVPQIENQLQPFKNAILHLRQLQITSQTQFEAKILFIAHTLAPDKFSA